MNDHEIQLLDFAELVQWLYCILFCFASVFPLPPQPMGFYNKEQMVTFSQTLSCHNLITVFLIKFESLKFRNMNNLA